jgi:hypothetical protein
VSKTADTRKRASRLMVATELMGVMADYSNRPAESRASVWSLCSVRASLKLKPRRLAVLDTDGVDEDDKGWLKCKYGDACVRSEVADLPYQ